MLNELDYCLAHIRRLTARLRDLGDDGYSTETVIITALLAIMAIAVVGIISAKVLAKANSIGM
jgi:hypothetical protein